MALKDINAVKRNIIKLRDAGAPDSDIDQYVQEEGYTPEQIVGGVSTSLPQKSLGQKVVSGIGNVISGLSPMAQYQGGKSVGLATAMALKGDTQPIKEVGKAFIKPYTSPIESLKEQPIETLAAWSPIGIGVGKGVSALGRGALRLAGMPTESISLLKKGIKPTKNYFNFDKDVKSVMPELYETSKEINVPIQDITSFNKVISAAKNKLWSAWGKIKGEGKLKEVAIDGDKIYNAKLSVLNKEFIDRYPTEAQSIIEDAKFYKGKQLTIPEVDNLIKIANNKKNAFYNKSQSGQRVDLTDPNVATMIREAGALRDEMFNALVKSGVEGKALRQKWGALTNIEEQSVGREMVAGRHEPINLQETVNYPFALAKGVKSVLTGDVVGGAESMGQIALARGLKQANKTDSLIKRAFDVYETKTQPRKMKTSTAIAGGLTFGQLGQKKK